MAAYPLHPLESGQSAEDAQCQQDEADAVCHEQGVVADEYGLYQQRYIMTYDIYLYNNKEKQE